jgi:transmembrane sensor
METYIERRRQDELDTIAEQAVGWLLELENASERGKAQFLKWIGESPLHVEAFLLASSVDDSLSRLSPALPREIKDGNAARVEPKVILIQSHAKRSFGTERAVQFAPRWLAAAAAIFALLMGSWWLHGTSSGWHDYATAVGEQRSVRLSDGSKIYINTTSRLQVRLSERGRDVRLLKGEALFDVQHDPARPFRVYSSDAVIQAVGTQFNVYRHAGITTVSVLEGKVRISPPGHKAAQNRPSLVRAVAAGEQADVTASGKLMKQAHMDTGRVTAWRQQRLVFTNDTLAEIAAEFNRYNEVPQIRIEDAAARARRYAAGFDADKPGSLVKFLANDPTLGVRREPGTVVIYSREQER